MENDRKKEVALNIGKKIYAIRKENNLTREKFAEACNISAQHVYYMEKGEFLPGCITLIDICNQFHVSPSEILLDSFELNEQVLKETTLSNFDKLSNCEKHIVVSTLDHMIQLFLQKDV